MMNNQNISVNDYIIDIKGLTKNYKTEGENLSVLKGLDLSVSAGSRVTIIGESGNGKSTLLNILGGIDSVTGGTVRSGPYQLEQLDEEVLTEYRGKFIGLIFQFHYLLKDFTALENIYLPAYMQGKSKKEALEKAEELLEAVGLSERKNHLPGQLSGGERQRIAVARSLINDPELILADEPTGNLDPANSRLIGDLLFNITKKYNKTLLLVTHDMKLAQMGDQQYRMKDGVLESVMS